MTCYFAFRSSDALRDGCLSLLDNFEKGSREPQGPLFVQVAQLFADEVVDVMLLNIVRSAESGHSSAKILEGFASLIKSTVHGLIRQVLGKMKNEELQPLSRFIRERRLVITENGVAVDYISFVMPAAFHARFKAVLAAGMNGEKNSDELLACMDQFSDLAHTAFYDDAMQQMKLGFIGRKVVDVGGGAIRKGSQAATKRLVPTLEGQELKDFSAYFHAFLIEN